MVHSCLMPRILCSSSITLLVKLAPLYEPGQGPKDRDVTSIYKFSNGFCSFTRGYICQHVFSEVVLENQDIGNSRLLI